MYLYVSILSGKILISENLGEKEKQQMKEEKRIYSHFGVGWIVFYSHFGVGWRVFYSHFGGGRGGKCQGNRLYGGGRKGGQKDTTVNC